MDQVTIRNVKFGSFFKVSVLISLSFGIIFGLIIFIIGLFGGPVQANIGAAKLTGIAGGVASLILGPFIFSIFGMLIGIFTFLPFKLILKVLKRITIYGKFEGVETITNTATIEDENSEYREYIPNEKE